MEEHNQIGTLREVSRRAGKILSENANRLILIEGLLLLSVTSAVYYLLWDLFFSVQLLTGCAAWMATVPAAALTLLFSLLLMFPLAVGFLTLAYRMCLGQSAPLVGIFAPFSSRRKYAGTLRLCFPFFLTATLTVFAEIGIYAFFDRFFSGEMFPAILCAALMICVGFLGLIIALWRFPLLFCALCAEDGQFDAIRAREKELGTGRRMLGVGFLFRFLPWILLGFLTVGILWLADTLPRMAAAYFCLFGADRKDPSL